MIDTITKQPAEVQPLAVEYASRLPTGAALASGTLAALDLSDDSDATSTVLASSTATISGTQASAILQAGTHGTDYQITLTVTLDIGSPYVLEDDFILRVRAG